MGAAAKETAFVTDPAGFVGAELVRLLVTRGHQVFALTDSPDVAERVRLAGATAVFGNLLTPGRWQDEAAADWVFHFSPQALDGPRVHTRTVAHARLLMDSHLLDAVAAGTTRRIVYVANTGCDDTGGARPGTEDDESARPSSGQWSLPLDRVEGYGLAGLPIVMAVPGCVFGNGAWFRRLVIDPILGGRRVVQFRSAGPLVSPVHIGDCVRALLHLASHGQSGRRYFVVGNEPARFNEFAATFARVAHRPLRTWRLPAPALRFTVGAQVPGGLRCDAVFSNIRLQGTGFRPEFSTLEQGIRQIARALHG